MSADDVILVAETERMALASGPESGAQLKLNIEVNRPYYTRSKFNLLNDYLKEKRTLKSRVAGFVGKCFPPTTGCLAKTLLSFFPFINILKHYSIRGDFVNDLISGLTVGVMHIPQGMAYGMLANVDPVYGLYTSFFPVIIYFFLGTSRHISMGTFAVVSLMVGSAVDKVDCTSELTSSVNHPDSNLTVTVYSFQNDNGSLGVNATSDFPVWTKEEQEQIDMCKIGTATAVTLLAGILQLIMGMCRFGFVTIYLSDPLTRALTTGAGVHVFTSQIRHIFGIKTGRFNGPLKLVYTYIVFFQHIVQTNLASLIMAVICIAILYSFQRWVSPRVKAIIRMPLPTELLLLIFGTLISYFVKFSSKEVFNMKVVGPIPEGFPSPAFPHTSRFSIILSDAIAIALVSFTISISMTKLFAKKHNYSFDPNQELMAYGISNILCSTVNCYVSTASLSRSIVQESVGGRTQVAGLVSCVVLFVVLLAVGPLFRELPNCVLAAIIIVNLRGIFLQVKDIKDLWRLSFFDMLTWIVTCLAVILTDVDIGLVIGVVFSLLSIVFRTQSPHTHILGRIPRTDVYEDVHHYPAAKQISNIKIFCFSSSLYYANAGHFVEKLYEKTECKPATVKSARNRMQRQLNAQKARAQGHAMKLCRNASKKETNMPISFVPDVPIDNNNHAKDAIADEDDRSYCSISNIIIDCTSMVFIDVVGIATLKQVVEEYKEIGVSVSLARCNEEIFEILQKAIECKKMSNCRIYLTVHDAVISAVDEDYSLKSQLRHDFNNIIAA